MTILKSRDNSQTEKRENAVTERYGRKFLSRLPTLLLSGIPGWRPWPVRTGTGRTGRASGFGEGAEGQSVGCNFPRSVLLNSRDSVLLVTAMTMRMRCTVLLIGCCLPGVLFGRESADINLNY